MVPAGQPLWMAYFSYDLLATAIQYRNLCKGHSLSENVFHFWKLDVCFYSIVNSMFIAKVHTFR